MFFRYLMSFTLRPIRFIKIVWQLVTGRYSLFHIYMKSGNVVKVRFKRMTVKYLNQEITRLEWEQGHLPCHDLMFIDLTQVESIVMVSQ